jgi:hypothetical protein
VTENLKNLLFSKINSEKPIDNFLSQKGRLLNHPPMHHPFETTVMTFLVRECYGSPKKQEFKKNL